jgi:hypothetical protein
MPKSNGFNVKTINHGVHAGLSIFFFKSTSTSLFTGGTFLLKIEQFS